MNGPIFLGLGVLFQIALTEGPANGESIINEVYVLLLKGPRFSDAISVQGLEHTKKSD